MQPTTWPVGLLGQVLDITGQSVREYHIIWSKIKVLLGNYSFDSQVHVIDEKSEIETRTI